MKKIVIIFLLVLLGCNTNTGKKETIIIKGSDTMVNLSKIWAIEFMKQYPNISVQINGGGSGTGIAALLNNTGQIANVSRELKQSETKKAKLHNLIIKKHIVALDAIAIIVNKNNKIDSLDFYQLKQIFTGKINNWKQLGGSSAKITLFGRENSSGTYEFVKNVILNNSNENINYDFDSSTQVLQGTSSLAEAIAGDVSAIGYGSLGYFAKRNDVKIIKIKKNKTDIAVNLIQHKQINYKYIWNGNYPLARYLYCFTTSFNNNAVIKYINFVKSQNGQKLVKEMEYIPLTYANK